MLGFLINNTTINRLPIFALYKSLEVFHRLICLLFGIMARDPDDNIPGVPVLRWEFDRVFRLTCEPLQRGSVSVPVVLTDQQPISLFQGSDVSSDATDMNVSHLKTFTETCIRSISNGKLQRFNRNV